MVNLFTTPGNPVRGFALALGAATLFLPSYASAQLQMGQAPASETPSTLTDPTFHPDVQVLLDADKQFAAEVLKGGGSAFLRWFAEDAVTLSNGKPTVVGKANISNSAQWKPEEYQLSWTPEGARIGPSRDMGVTWGSYQGHSRDHQGSALETSGRYITVWRKEKSGQWKVVLDASNDAPPEAGSCCSVH